MTTQSNSETKTVDMQPVTIEDGGDLHPVIETRDQPFQPQQQNRDDDGDDAPIEYFEDPRKRIAAQQRAKRDAKASDMPFDDRMTPPFVNQQADDDDDDPDDSRQNNANTQQGAVQRAAPSDSGAGQKFNLTVNRNNFEVSRADALRYAEIEPSEADLYTDVQIVRLAQKHLAANQFLEESKTARNSARAARADGSQPGDDDDAAFEPQTRQAQPQNNPSRGEEVIEALQFEDPTTAREKLDAYLTDFVDTRLAGRTKAQKYEVAQTDILNATAEIEAAHADIMQDEYAAEIASRKVLDEAGEELMRGAGVSKQQVDWLRSQGKLVQAYAAAQADGFQVRSPREVLEAAAQKTRAIVSGSRFAPPLQQQQQPQNPRTHDRFQAKRGLIQQPTRNASQQPTTRSQPNVSVEDSRKAALLKRRADQRERLR